MLKFLVKWASIIFLATILWHLLERITGLHDVHIHLHPYYTNLFFVVVAILYVFALKQRKVMLENNITYKQAFWAGTSISLVTSILSPLSTWLIHKVISPDYFLHVINYTVKNNLMTASQAQSMFSIGNYMVQGVVGSLIIGIIISAVVAFFIMDQSKGEKTLVKEGTLKR